MELFRETFPGIPIGFSENSLGIDTATVAVALGATIVERHFTLSRNSWGADQHICSEPAEFRELTARIRVMESDPRKKEEWLRRFDAARVRGKKEKVLQKDEEALRPLWRKSLMVGCDIPEGAAITADMLFAMRPQKYAGGLPSERYEEVLGKRTTKALKKYEPITKECLV